jgi:hypothetical protein
MAQFASEVFLYPALTIETFHVSIIYKKIVVVGKD